MGSAYPCAAAASFSNSSCGSYISNLKASRGSRRFRAVSEIRHEPQDNESYAEEELKITMLFSCYKNILLSHSAATATHLLDKLKDDWPIFLRLTLHLVLRYDEYRASNDLHRLRGRMDIQIRSPNRHRLLRPPLLRPPPPNALSRLPIHALRYWNPGHAV